VKGIKMKSKNDLFMKKGVSRTNVASHEEELTLLRTSFEVKESN